VWLWALAALLPGSIAQGSQTEADRHLCGPRCLAFCARWLGHEAPVRQLAAATGADRRTGTDLGSLLDAAERLGLEARAYRLELPHLRRVTPRCPGIAHVDGDHFVVVWTDSDGDLHWIEPPIEDRVMSYQAFGRRWSGAILVVSRPGEQPTWPRPARWISGALFLVAAALCGWKLGRAVRRRTRTGAATAGS
jgi:ABC-type bacteriocin/lantibiotic exporter with double-glycine peptidase domain